MSAPTRALTSRQVRIVNAIRDFHAENGYSPSLREVGKAAGLVSPSSVVYQLGQLAEQYILTFDPKIPRSVVLTPPPLDDVCGHCKGTGLKPAGDVG